MRTTDRDWSLDEIRARLAIEDLYDRQLAAAEAHDWVLYDSTFAADARIDLGDFGEPVRSYPEYRVWLAGLARRMPRALRLTGGLRLALEADRATTRVPVFCCVKLRGDGKDAWTFTALFYNDELRRTKQGWRITRRYEELVYPDESEGPGRA